MATTGHGLQEPGFSAKLITETDAILSDGTTRLTMADKHSEMDFLESVVDTYVTSESPQDRLIKTLAVRTFKPHMRAHGNALEFGCCDGFMSSLIAPLCDTLTVIDGSKRFIEMARLRAPGNVEFVNTLFEDYAPGKTFDYIFATYVLEHVTDAVGLLK